MRGYGLLCLLLLVGWSLSSANAATIRYDMGSNEVNGYFVVDTATDTFTDWYMVGGQLLGGADYYHYAGGLSQNLGGAYPNTASFECQTLCTAQFTTYGDGASSGEVFLTLTWLATITGTGTLNVFEQEAPAIYQDTGTISLTVLVPDATPLPATLPLFATGLGGLGLLGWRRKRKAQAVA